MACPVSTDVSRAAKLLQEGNLVAFATETVYGLGANAFDPHAVARIFEVKGRPKFDPLIVHVANQAGLESLVTAIPPAATKLAEKFWPGPLTLVLPKTDLVPDLVSAGLSTVAVRIPDHPQALELLSQADIPIAAPSANPFGQISPTTAAHVTEQLGEKIEGILDGGPCRVGVESTVLQLTETTPLLLRPGGLPVEEIEAIVGPVKIVESSEHPTIKSPASPGMLPRHYAPQTPLDIVESLHDCSMSSTDEQIGLLTFQPTDVPSGLKFSSIEVLSESGDLTEATASFFAALRRLDTQHLTQIVALLFPEEGLGRALNDRLQRASVR